MEFSRHKYWSRLPIPTPGDVPNPGIEPTSFVSPALAGGFLPLVPPGKVCVCVCVCVYGSLCHTAEANTILESNYTPIKEKDKKMPGLSSPCTHTKERPYEHIAKGNCH